MSGHVHHFARIIGSPLVTRTSTPPDENGQAQFNVGDFNDGLFLYATPSELIELSDNLARVAVALLQELTGELQAD